MTPHLHVQVRLNGAVVEDRLVQVRNRVWLGECDGAEVAFTGGILGIRAADGELWHRGRKLPLDQPVDRTWGAVDVRMTSMLPDRLPRDWSWVPDPMLLVCTVALLLGGAFSDTVAAQMQAKSIGAEDERQAGRVQLTEERYRVDPVVASVPQDSWPPPATFEPEQLSR